jgi:hypothetical protein
MIRRRPPRARKPCSRRSVVNDRSAPVDIFNWQPGERVVRVGKPRLSSDVLERCQALYAPSMPEGEAK